MFSALKKFLGGAEKKEILAPVSGKVIPMSQVADPTFSQEILGKGVAVIPSEGRIVESERRVFRGPCKAGRPGKSGRSSRDGGFRESKRRRI